MSIFTESIPQIFVPQFTGDSYMEMPLEERIYDALSITVWFKALKPNGLQFFLLLSLSIALDQTYFRKKKRLLTFYILIPFKMKY